MKKNIWSSPTMKALWSFPENQFLRIHKSYIINLRKVVNYSASNKSISRTEFPLSRTKKRILERSMSQILVRDPHQN